MSRETSRALYKVRTILVLLALPIKVTVCVEKYWLPNLEWETAENWIGGRLPEMDSRVTFPLDMRHAAGIGKSAELRLSGIDLPRSGSLVLPRAGNLQLIEAGKSQGKTSEWRRSGHIFWADPENWNGTAKAAPHLEQVPCRQDDIVLPAKQRTFSIQLPIRDIEVRSIRTADEKHTYSAWQWSDLENRREFGKGLFTVKYAEYSCDKCSCQNDPDGSYLEEICAIERPKCGYVACEFPLTVEGHCCRYCGGRVSLTNKASLPVVRAAADEALEGYAKRLAWHVRRTWNGAAEVLIKEKGQYTSIDIIEAVEAVKRTLLAMKIEVVSTESAGAALQDTRLVVALVPLLGTPFIILFLLFLVFLYFGYSYRHVASGCTEIFFSIGDGIRVDKSQPAKPFGFARFENVPEGSVQIASVASISEPKAEDDKARSEDPSSCGRFENPLYRSKRKRKEEKEDLDMNAPLSLATLRDRVESQMEEVEMNIDE